MQTSTPLSRTSPESAASNQSRTRLSRPAVAGATQPYVGRKKVLVTGAGGRTGKLIVEELLRRKYDVQALVRSSGAVGALQDAGLSQSNIVVGDLLSPGRAELLDTAVAGCSAMVIATSAVPKIVFLSLLRVILKRVLRQDPGRPDFTFKSGQLPQQVDWEAQKAQIDAARKAGMEKVVLISSMGITQPENPLNAFGNGNILLWKRKAEEYLISQQSLDHTIIHPGGLVDDQGGARKLVLGVDDELLEGPNRSIPRADVAELAVQSLELPEARNRSVDVVSLPPGEESPTRDYSALFRSVSKNCSYTPLPPEAAALTQT